MANQIEVTDLASQAASSIDSDTQVVAFTQSGDTNRLPFIEAVAYANQVNECICIKEASLTIASADVLTLNTTPLTIVAAQGAGTAIEVISASMNMVYNSATYATNTSLELLTAGATNSQASTVIKNSASTIRRFADATTLASATATQLVDNAALNVTVASGDPTAGDSDIKIYVTYRVITL